MTTLDLLKYGLQPKSYGFNICEKDSTFIFYNKDDKFLRTERMIARWTGNSKTIFIKS